MGILDFAEAAAGASAAAGFGGVSMVKEHFDGEQAAALADDHNLEPNA